MQNDKLKSSALASKRSLVKKIFESKLDPMLAAQYKLDVDRFERSAKKLSALMRDYAMLTINPNSNMTKETLREISREAKECYWALNSVSHAAGVNVNTMLALGEDLTFKAVKEVKREQETA